MSQARTFIHVSNSDLQTLLMQLPAMKRCIVTSGSELGFWLEECIELEANIAIIDMDAVTARELSQVESLDNVDFMFFSDGNPNPALDTLMAKGGGYHFRTPFNETAINEALEDLLEDHEQRTRQKTQALTSDLDQFGQLVGSHKSMRKLYRAIRRVAGTDANVLVIGESGTGKELVANTIHAMSPRSDEPMVAINCGALSPELIDSQLFGHKKGAFTGATSDHKGVFEQAGNGTVFLDEVTEMPIEQQVKLLRVLEQSEFKPVGSERTLKTSARIIAATNRDPFDAMENSFLREDLYFRLAQFPLTVPALNERGEDVTGLAKHFVAYLNQVHEQHIQIEQAALDLIAEHHWPGNVRELRHCIERAFILAEDAITRENILILASETETNEEVGVQGIPTGVPLEEIEQAAIEKTLEENEGNKTETADQLGISVKTLYNKLDKYQSESDN
ncbi:sigma-54-dependent Fis family transcriptional regulator [Oleiphilus sp. HI0071]|uniref:sigma-54 interaction domain-containing protein n=1 Tax=Oleiphilus sp. HI0080 TaxID=1822255 RepID=UPI0007C202CD|nr:sigma-54 dependent transcriptional regulator [Oleiphilus sp. HI0080]KZY62852.1 sigma-54-dependent Fis family transcriptional regulator [Oleiphilus sp. HI0065]KZY80698.1 sigma-54-dependent Fis family transcriptional regulator [Oleiphilus sp. HI0071]KZZ04996.1 sigma-54-dependent Fis family transcriptional regulator [Oleiphilus sp. HI0073]KZZ55051.1 sigma-54-dependent Fis family transcriptional regulator [Oleiphilus sp. HI0122]KZY64653.1 sigma-54-dependent Fis family transcriptional regulator 